MRKLVIIPTYNERENIQAMIAKVFALPEDFHLLVIDDGSPDGTAALVREWQSGFPQRLFLIERSGKLGLGTAYLAGFRWALEHEYDYIFEMDADFSHNPDDLLHLYAALRGSANTVPESTGDTFDEESSDRGNSTRQGDVDSGGAALEKYRAAHSAKNEAVPKREKSTFQGADVAVGSRYIQGVNVVNWPMSRLLISYFASRYVRLATRMPVRDATAGFVGYSRRVLEQIDLDRVKMKGYGFQIEMKYSAWRLGFSIKEVSIIFTERVLGTSKMSSGIFGEAFWGVIALRFRKIRRKH